MVIFQNIFDEIFQFLKIFDLISFQLQHSRLPDFTSRFNSFVFFVLAIGFMTILTSIYTLKHRFLTVFWHALSYLRLRRKQVKETYAKKKEKNLNIKKVIWEKKMNNKSNKKKKKINLCLVEAWLITTCATTWMMAWITK